MNKRLRKKIPREWTAFDIGDRKKRPGYTRDQCGRALGGTVGRHRPGRWPFARKGRGGAR